MPRLIREMRRPTRYPNHQERKEDPQAGDSRQPQSTLLLPVQEMSPRPLPPVLSGTEEYDLLPVPLQIASVDEVKPGYVLDNGRLFAACTWENLSEAMKWVIMEELGGVEEDYGRARQLLKLDNDEYNAFIDLGIRENNREELRENLKEAIINESLERERTLNLKKHTISKKEYAKQLAQVSTSLNDKLEQLGGPRTYSITKDDLAQAKRFLIAKLGCCSVVTNLQRRLKLYTNEVWQYPLVICAKGEEDDPDCLITLSDNEEECSTSKAGNKVATECVGK